MVLSMSPIVWSQSNFSAVVELSDLDGSDGFVINGVNENDFSGRSVSKAGDINGDGIDDLIIGAFRADPNDIFNAGESYVIFGGGGIGSAGVIELSGLDGSNGFVINGNVTSGLSGNSVSAAGDLNGDGFGDLIIGRRYVVFGGFSLGGDGSIELSDLNGGNGFVLNSNDLGDRLGTSVSGAGDVNGDGVDDLLVGAWGGDPNGENSGESYVVLGGIGLGSDGSIELSDLDGSDGFVLNGIDAYDFSGLSVSGAGDINGDGVDDLIIAAPNADQNGNFQAGESYVVFGASSVGSGGIIELSDLDGSDGFVLNGIDSGDVRGVTEYLFGVVSGVGDINGDDIDDLIIGAPGGDPNGNRDTGESYVVFGGTVVGGSGAVELSALDGTNGFILNGIDMGDRLARSVSGAGDINGDDIGDLVIGADEADPNGNLRAGESFVVFGGAGIGSDGVIELSLLDGSNGFVVNGIDVRDYSGGSVSDVGDVNGDGVDDLIVGARRADPNGDSDAGESYVVFGKDVPQCNGKFVTVDLNFGQTPGPGSDVILGTEDNDDIRGRAGDDTICGMGGDDFIHGNSGNDWIDGGDGVDDLRGGQGDDVVNTGSGSTVGTSSIVFGGTGDDEINGGSGNDDLRGGRGVDTINGNAGNDVITGNADGDIINGGAGDDELRGGQGDDTLNGESGDDFLSGGGGTSDTCDGGSELDTATLSCETVTDVP